MTLQYLMDENVDPVYALQLRRRQPDLVVWAVGEPNAPPKSTLDPEILLSQCRYEHWRNNRGVNFDCRMLF
jgi:hypothetical protein